MGCTACHSVASPRRGGITVSVVALARHGLDGPVVITMCGEAKRKANPKNAYALACLLLASCFFLLPALTT
eukprot:scaffold13291_cov80-Skeletonema_marinoi.AAC.1